MADEMHHPHDMMVRAVLSDLAEATSFLQTHLPQEVSQARSWSYSSEFADLFTESVRDWPGVPRFSHGLIDQSGLQPDEVQGELKTQLMQLVMLAAYHPAL